MILGYTSGIGLPDCVLIGPIRLRIMACGTAIPLVLNTFNFHSLHMVPSHDGCILSTQSCIILPSSCHHFTGICMYVASSVWRVLCTVLPGHAHDEFALCMRAAQCMLMITSFHAHVLLHFLMLRCLQLMLFGYAFRPEPFRPKAWGRRPWAFLCRACFCRITTHFGSAIPL